MAPAVAARNSVNLDRNNITIYYPADRTSDTALAYHNEDLERQRREPQYEPPCYQIQHPKKEHVKTVEDGHLETQLKRKLCDCLGYAEHEYDAPNKAPRYAVAPHALNHHRPTQGAQQPAYHANYELTPAFANAAGHAVSMPAARTPQTIAYAAGHAVSMPAARTPQTIAYAAGHAVSMPAARTPQTIAYAAGHAVSMQAARIPQTIAYAAGHAVSMPAARTPQTIAYAAGHAVSMPAARMPQTITYDRYRNVSSPSHAPPNPAVVTRQLHPTTSHYPPQSYGQRPASPYAPQSAPWQPTPAACQQPFSEAQYAAFTKAAADTRQYSSPSMAPNMTSSSLAAIQHLPAAHTHLNHSPRSSISPPMHSPQVSPPRIDSPQHEWLANAAGPAMQPLLRAGSPRLQHPPSASKQPGVPQLLYPTADRRFWVTESVSRRFLQPLVQTEPSRTLEQLRRARETAEGMRRQLVQTQEQWRAKAA